MADPNLILKIYPHAGLPDSVKVLRQLAGCVLPKTATSSTQRRRRRHATLPLPMPKTTDEALAKLPHLPVRFNNVPRSSTGVVFGQDPTVCDVVFPEHCGSISRAHFAVTFKNVFPDGRHRLIIRDLGSEHGTVVSYDGQCDLTERRNNFDWIVDGFDILKQTEPIILGISEELQFLLVIRPHNLQSAAYIENVKRFCRGRGEDPATNLRLGGNNTREIVSQNAVSCLTLETELLGEGGYGIVTGQWDVSTGEVYARKEPKAVDYKGQHILREIRMMRTIEHVSRVGGGLGGVHLGFFF